MHHFRYKRKRLYCEDISLKKVAEKIGTPFYCYSYATLERHFRRFDQACQGFPHLICFAMKSNSNQAIMRALIKMGAGIDLVSGGELYRALKAGADPKKIIFSGVGKSEEEFRQALQAKILMVNVESEEELLFLQKVAKAMGQKARVALRVNPNIDPKTHPYISTGLRKNKFGIPIERAMGLYKRMQTLSHIETVGLSCHIGSQITTLSPFKECIKKMSLLLQRLRRAGHPIRYLDLGGGLGIPYRGEKIPDITDYINVLQKDLKATHCTILFEPGRVIMGNAGVLVTKTLYNKKQGAKRFVIVDAAMNDLMRPALYGSFHEILAEKKSLKRLVRCDMVGPVCESGDFFAKNRSLPALEAGDLAVIMSAGAYGFSMASHYNSRPKVAEVMVKGGKAYIVRQRESYRDLIKGEKLPRFLK